ncbi:efflux RND transporter periplasmic adaptor subunit [Dyella sp. 20L07]|uniref:efflux RND transporter periplasmic adaptor subunit n=1 Tax=Dyella sp. 20L07 TaxID=3384240 RepID=UPI003D268DA4
MLRRLAGWGFAALATTTALAAEPTIVIPTAAVTRVERMPIAQLPVTVRLPLEGTSVVTVPLAGVVLDVRAREGDLIKRGQPLARLQSREAMTLGADLAAAQGAYRVAAAQAARDQQLLAEGIVPQARVQASVATRDAAAARLRELDAARAWAPSVSGAGMGVYELRAPVDGRVLERALQPGNTAEALAKAFVLVSGHRVLLELRVPASVAVDVRRGQEVRTSEGTTARVSETGGALDAASQTVLVRAEGDAVGLMPGMQTSATLWIAAPADAVSIPASALAGEDSNEQIYVRRDGGFRAMKVAVIGRDGDARRIVRGELKPGDDVATGLLDQLQSRTSTEGR